MLWYPGDVIYVFECATKHRVLRKSRFNNAPCSHCGRALEFLGEMARLPEESEGAHEQRAIKLKRGRAAHA